MSPSAPNCALLLALLVPLGHAILIGSSTETSTSSTSAPNVEANATFYYEASAFLLNKNASAATQLEARQEPASEEPAETKETTPKVRAASVAMTSGRSGRAMDLDALVGDVAASRANKERSASISGSRQSRFMPGLDVPPGKKLHIQGFIPIMSVKDAAGDEADEEADAYAHQSASQKAHRPRAQTLGALAGDAQLPYAQSSIGHASYGVHRYLNGDAQPPAQLPQQQQHFFDSSHLVEPQKSASGAAAVVDTIRRPIKKLAELASAGNQYSSLISRPQQAGGQCLCVPFYMCKNGFISESGLAKHQVQQLIAQQQQQQQLVAMQPPARPSPYDQIEMKSSPLNQPQLVATSQAPASSASYADSYVPVDERSFDRELITMSSLVNLNDSTSATNLTDGQPLADFGALEGPQQELSQEAQLLAQASNASDPNSDYSQEILGRMLGLKSGANQRQSSAGACGLLRTCCQVPLGLGGPQDLMSHERLLAQLSGQQPQPHQFYPQPQVQRVSQPANALQRQYQQQVSRAQPYGLPQLAQLGRQLPQPATSSALDRRTHQFPGAAQTQLANRYQQLGAQYTRSAALSPPTLQSFQQPAPGALTRSLPPQQQLAPPGTRKILDGRCGLRQAMGVTGRVQNLQYHESSAEFGEYPAQAAILKRLPGADSLFVCGGTLISQYWVATAAHCIRKHSQQSAELRIRLGEWDVHRDDEFYPFVEKDVRDIVIHPEFVAGNLANDLALLRLDSAVDPSLPHVNPACLPAADESFARQHCWVTGWGKDSFGQRGSFQSVLREVELPVVGHAECEAALRQTRLGPHYRLGQGFVCAGGEGGKDACEGDGGSGLYCAQDGVVKVAGLVSWGIGCGQAGVPGVYVNMAHYRPWIESIIAVDEDLYSPYANMLAAGSPISERSSANATHEQVAATSEAPRPPQ